LVRLTQTLLKEGEQNRYDDGSFETFSEDDEENLGSEDTGHGEAERLERRVELCCTKDVNPEICIKLKTEIERSKTQSVANTPTKERHRMFGGSGSSCVTSTLLIQTVS